MILKQLRMESLQVVENCIKLRNQIKSIYSFSTDECKMSPVESIPAMHNGTNYLVKMKTDTMFLAHSELNKWFNFSNKADPFFVTPASSYVTLKGASKYT